MSKEKFISELYLRLLWKCSKRERMEIIHDMKEYFEIAFSSGRAEKEICEELGRPKDVIRRIAKEEKQQGPDDSYTLEWLGRCVAVFVYISILGFLIIPLGNSNWIILSILMPVEGILLWCVLGGRFFNNAWLMKKQENGLKKIIILHVCYFIVSISTAIYFVNAGLDWKNWMWFVKEASDYGLYLKMILLVMLGLFAVMYVIGIISFQRYSIAGYSLAIHALGSSWMIFAFLHMLLVTTDPILVIPFFIRSMLIYAEGIIFTLGFLYYFHNLLKKERL